MTKERGKIDKYANCGISKNLSEKGTKKSEAPKIIASTIVQRRAHDKALKVASCMMKGIVLVMVTFLGFF